MEMTRRSSRISRSWSLPGAVALLAVLLSLAGCVGGRTIRVDVGYKGDKTQNPFAGEAPLKVALIPFEKEGQADTVLGDWVGLTGGKDAIVSEKPVEVSMTDAVHDYLVKAGFEVSMAPKGSDVSTYSNGSADVVLGGVVKKFYVRAASRFGRTDLDAAIYYTVTMRNVKDGSTLTVNLNGISKPVTVVAFDGHVFQNTVDSLVRDTVSKLFSEVTLKERLLRPSK